MDHLAAIGVDHVFGVDGANIEDLYDAAHFHPSLCAVLAKHEFSAAAMADGYSRSGAGMGSGLGVVATTSGGGALNLVAGLGEALASRVPVLALVGQSATALDGRGAFQDTSGCNGSLDAEAVFSAVSLSCQRVLAPAEIVSALPRAIAAARAGGPAVLLLPKDIQQGYVAIEDDQSRQPAQVRPIGNPYPIARTLRRANGPVTIIVGEQVARDNCRPELEQLRAVLRARVATVPEAMDVAGTPGLGSSSVLGVTGVMGHPSVAEAVAGSAVCLVVGTRLPVTARAGLEDALAAVRTVSIGSAPPYLPCTHLHTDDLRGSLRILTEALSGSGRPTGLRVPDVVRRAELLPPSWTGAGVRYRDAMAVLNDELPDGTDIVVDAGNTGAAAIHYLPAAGAAGSLSRSAWAAWATVSGPASEWLWDAPTPDVPRTHRGDRRGRGVFHARHGGAHRRSVPASGDVRLVQQQCPRHVCDPRAVVLRRSIQLQPISPQPPGLGPGGDVSGPDVCRRHRCRAFRDGGAHHRGR
ncbi:thiamine pyrophosphate enzyme, N-terminal TPP binding domain protein [Mycobacterium kansasii 732]|nr:thiamine pyrophosphate enzyme, N-terminal TPP binding domain protein [Mycobacterium kansasii 732]